MTAAPPRTATGKAEGLTPADRLRRRADYLRCYREGRRRHGELAVVHAIANGEGRPRLGITASRKVGGSVVRQRLKRRVREIYRRWDKRASLPAIDLVVHLKPASATADFGPLRRELERQLGSLASAPPPPPPPKETPPRPARRPRAGS